MDEYRKAVVKVLQETQGESGKLGGRELLELLVRKWGVAYDLQIRKSAPFGEGSANIYVNGIPPFLHFNENVVWDLFYIDFSARTCCSDVEIFRTKKFSHVRTRVSRTP